MAPKVQVSTTVECQDILSNKVHDSRLVRDFVFRSIRIQNKETCLLFLFQPEAKCLGWVLRLLGKFKEAVRVRSSPRWVLRLLGTWRSSETVLVCRSRTLHVVISTCVCHR